MTSTNADLSAITAGQEVFLRTGVHNAHRVTVERVTKTQIIADGSKYRISDGHRVGANTSIMGFYVPRLVALDTPELLITEATNAYTAALRLLSEYAQKTAGYADPIKAEADMLDLTGLFDRVQSAKHRVVTLRAQHA